MIRKLYEQIHVDGKNYVELACLSTDSKPTAGVITGSLALEVDTGDVYAFDEVGGEWGKIAELGGAGDSSVASTLSSTPVLSMNRPAVMPQTIGEPAEEPQDEEPVEGEDR